MTQLTDQYYTIEQVALRLNQTSRQVRNLCRAGYIGELIAGVRLINRREFEKFKAIVRPEGTNRVRLMLEAWRASQKGSKSCESVG